jgi:predicted ATPase
VSATRFHIEESLRLCNRPQRDAQASRTAAGIRIYSLVVAAWALWWLGYPDQAAQRVEEALTRAQELAHPFTLTWALCRTGFVLQFYRAVPAIYERAEAALALGTAHGFRHLVAWGMLLRGWTLAAQGHGEAGITQMRQGLAAWQSTGAEMDIPHLLALLAEGYQMVGQTEQGLAILTEALAAAEAQEQRLYEAELYRLKGELLLAQAAAPCGVAEACLHHALRIACSQRAKSLELRAAISLARLWQHQGKRAEARQLRREVYGWFTEGFATADHQDAQAVLATLG